MVGPVILNDPKWSITHISRSRYYLKMNISGQLVPDTISYELSSGYELVLSTSWLATFTVYRYRCLLYEALELHFYRHDARLTHTPKCTSTTGQVGWLVVWHSGRTSVSDRRTFADLRSTCGWRVTTYVGKPSAAGQPTRPTQPVILSG